MVDPDKALPSPRLVSIVVHADVSHLHGRYTLMLMQFGQFLDHDVSLTPVNKVLIVIDTSIKILKRKKERNA